MDHESMRINVHWIKNDQDITRYHVEKLPTYFFSNVEGLRTVHRAAVKNILDWERVGRLEMICKQVDGVQESGSDREDGRKNSREQDERDESANLSVSRLTSRRSVSQLTLPGESQGLDA